MIVLGIDPGTATSGYAVVEKNKSKTSLLDCGVILTEKSKDSAIRLKEIFDELGKLIKRWKVEELAVELVFFNTNAKTVLAVGESRGVVKLAAAKSQISVFEYTPLQVKMALTGYGRAEKKQIGEMVRREFKLESAPKPDDASDAAAIALCHCYSRKMRVIE